MGASARAGHPFSLEIISPDRPSTYVNLGPHPPRLWPEDIDRLHDIWLRLSAQEISAQNCITGMLWALHSGVLAGDLEAGKRDDIVESLGAIFAITAKSPASSRAFLAQDSRARFHAFAR